MPNPLSDRFKDPVVGTFRPTVKEGERMICLMDDNGVPLAVFGPDTNAKARYVAQQCETGRVLPGATLGTFETETLGGESVALLDEKGRPWAFTGQAGDPESEEHAHQLQESHVFSDAVRVARLEELSIAGVKTAYPPQVAEALAAGSAASPQQVEAVAAWVDRHWTD